MGKCRYNQVLDGHPSSWVDYINRLVLGVEVTGEDRIIVQVNLVIIFVV